MTGFFIFLHATACVCLIAIILMQSGRGGGLTEGFAAAESMFGAKTNSFMVKSTTTFALLFLITCLSLAILSSKKDRSLMASVVPVAEDTAERFGTPVDQMMTNAVVDAPPSAPSSPEMPQ